MQRIYDIGGADLALRYHEIASRAKEQPREYRLIGLRFYTLDPGAAQAYERQFATLFPRSTTSRVYFQLEVGNPWSSIATDHKVRARFFKPDGSPMGELEEKVATERGSQTFFVARGWGWDDPGNYEPGVYRVDVEVGFKPLGSGEFTIYEDKPKSSIPAMPGDILSRWNLNAPLYKQFKIEDVTKTEEPKGLGFDGWMKKLQETFPNLKQPVTDPGKPLDDMAKMRRFMDIDRRYVFALPNSYVGRANEKVVQELKSIAAEYQKLLKAGPTKFQIYTEESLKGKVADVHSSIARAAEAIRDCAEAEREYKMAAELFSELGKPEEAERCRENLARLKYGQGGNFNAEIKRLRGKLSKIPAGSIEYAETVIELAGLVGSGAGDDYEAKKLFLQGETILEALTDEKGKRIGDPGGMDLAHALTNSLLSLTGKKALSGASPIERMLKVSGLQREVYLGLARIYDKAEPEKARSYREKAAKGDSRAVNREFSDAMQRALKGELGQ